MNKRAIRCLISSVVLSGAIVTGCQKKDMAEGDPFIIDLESNLSKADRNNLDQGEWDIDVITLEETDSTLLNGMRLLGVHDSEYWGVEKGEFYRFDKKGTCTGIISKYGEGPDEYTSLYDEVLLPDGNIAVVDGANDKFLEYDRFGKLVCKEDFHYGAICATKEGMVAVSMPDGLEKPLYAYWLNDSLQPTDSVWIAPGRDVSKGFINMPGLWEMDGRTSLTLGDSVFALNRDGLSPWLVFNTGRLSLPDEVAADFSRRDERKNYIAGLYGLVWENLAFVRYDYDNKFYFDVWNLPESRLVYRNTVAGPEDTYGFPIRTSDGKTYHVWPKLSAGGKLSGTFQMDYQPEPSDENSNPRIFTITKKH